MKFKVGDKVVFIGQEEAFHGIAGTVLKIETNKHGKPSYQVTYHVQKTATKKLNHELTDDESDESIRHLTKLELVLK
jgi:preprotein translocase subunit YajC